MVSSTPKLRSVKHFTPGEIPLTVHYHPSVRPGQPHGHEFYELAIITGGGAVHETGTDRWRISAGDVLVITGERPHRYTELEQLSLYNVLFDQERMQLPDLDLQALEGYHALFRLEPIWRRRHEFKSRLRLSAADLARAESMAAAIKEELDSKAPGRQFMAAGLFMQLICFLSRCYRKMPTESSRALLRIAGTISRIETDYEAEISLDELAESAGLSRRSFQRCFKEATGSSPIDYLVKVRVRRAAQLLQGSDDSVTRIAFSVGFNDSNYFARAFRKIMGRTPSAWRRSARSKA